MFYWDKTENKDMNKKIRELHLELVYDRAIVD